MTDPGYDGRVSGLVFAILSALSWAGLDAFRKLLAARLDVVALVVLLGTGQGLGFALWALLDGSLPVTDAFAYAPPAAGSLILNVLANVAFMRAVQVSPLSLTVPLLSLTPVFSAAVAIPLLREWPTPAAWAGIAVVVAGALTLHAGGDTRSLGGLFRALWREPGSRWMGLTALCWSLSSPLDKLALDHGSVPFHSLVQTGGMALVLGVVLLVRGRVGTLAEARGSLGLLLRLLLGAVLLAGAALALQLVAVQTVFVALVETVKRAVGMSASVVVGRVMFGEPITAPKLVAVGLMTAGTAVLAFG